MLKIFLEIVLTIGFIFLILVFYVYHGFGYNPHVIRSGSKNNKKIALTFDDGPDPNYTPGILDILKKENIKATFFIVGKKIEAYPELTERIVKEGHDFGSHTFNHKNLILAKATTVLNELSKTDWAIWKKTGKRPLYFRPPFGLYNPRVNRVASGFGYKIILWTLSSEDWRGLSVKKIAKRIISKVRPGNIILFHDSTFYNLYNKKNKDYNIIEAMSEIIKKLKDQGFKLVTISELLKD